MILDGFFISFAHYEGIFLLTRTIYMYIWVVVLIP